MNTNTHTTKIQTIINPKSHSSKPKFVNWVINIFDCFFSLLSLCCVCATTIVSDLNWMAYSLDVELIIQPFIYSFIHSSIVLESIKENEKKTMYQYNPIDKVRKKVNEIYLGFIFLFLDILAFILGVCHKSVGNVLG